MKLSPAQESVLLRMQPVTRYSIKELGCQWRTLSVLWDWGLIDRSRLSNEWFLTDYGVVQKQRILRIEKLNSPSGQE